MAFLQNSGSEKALCLTPVVEMCDGVKFCQHPCCYHSLPLLVLLTRFPLLIHPDKSILLSEFAAHHSYHFCFLNTFFLFFGCWAGQILVSRPRIKPMPPAVESYTTGPLGSPTSTTAFNQPTTDASPIFCSLPLIFLPRYSLSCSLIPIKTHKRLHYHLTSSSFFP